MATMTSTPLAQIPPSLYVCPQCKGSLHDFACRACGISYPLVSDIPCFLPESGNDSRPKIREIYDDIYDHHENVWTDQGRSERFLTYCSDLVASFSRRRVLEIGCGEGMQLAALSASRRFGVDPSVRALLRAKGRSNAECAVARAEELPFPAQSFDVVLAIGVMEHFENPVAATAEIARVLTPQGRYITLIHTDMTRYERVALKVREYFLPRFRPIALLTWLGKKIFHPIVQPLRKSYTIQSATECLELGGLGVLELIARRTHPTAPLAGDHVVILIAGRKE
jgi:ubiquinone/menaquinone biosynthesis C-methylase UbiE